MQLIAQIIGLLGGLALKCSVVLALLSLGNYLVRAAMQRSMRPRLGAVMGKTMLLWALGLMGVFAICALTLGVIASLELAYHFGH